MAAKLLSADVVSFDVAASSTTKGETLRDTAQNIQALNADMIVLRHSASGSPLYLSRVLDIPVVNAGDGAHEHPTQALLDAFTMREKLGDLKGRKIVILGDILFSRVARSNIHALTKLGANVTIVGPSTLVPHWFEALGVKVSHNLRSALADADVVMLLRIQHERQASSHFPSLGEYTSMFGLNQTRASWLKPDAIIMHPGPINRGVEIDSALADSERSVILRQVTNGSGAHASRVISPTRHRKHFLPRIIQMNTDQTPGGCHSHPAVAGESSLPCCGRGAPSREVSRPRGVRPTSESVAALGMARAGFPIRIRGIRG
jgi:aspartate carbamoyltransferase catalytic subunit